MTGTIYRLLPNKGYGFIRGADGVSYFFHVSTMVEKRVFDQLREGVGVDFDPSLSDKNEPRAENVTCSL